MSGSNRILVIIFVFFLIVIVGEIGFYFFYKPKIKIVPQAVNQQIQEPKPTSVSKPLGSKNQVLNPDYVNYLSSLEKKDYATYFLTINITGYIGVVNLTPYEKNKIQYQGNITIVDKQNNILENIGLSDKELKMLSIYKKQGNDKVKIDVKDLKPSQNILFISTLDLSKDARNDVIANEIDVL